MPNARPVIAHHLILTCYGFWLPNDPRGSGSLRVWSQALRQFGRATHVDTARSVADRPHDTQARRAAKHALRRSPVRLTGRQARAVVHGFAQYAAVHGVGVLACAVMPDHAHCVVRQIAGDVRRLAVAMKAASVHALGQAGLHPYQDIAPEHRPKVWARGQRVVYLFDAKDVRRSIRYVEGNPIRAGFKRQHWSFVQGIDSTEMPASLPRTK